MNNRILFMIIDKEVRYLQNSTMDHREWYNSLGLDPNNFENIVRGFIVDNKIVFYKGINFNYDEEVITKAKAYAPSMRITLNNLNMEIYCGVVINSYGEKWEPIVKINDNELTGIIEEKQEPQKEKKIISKEPTPIIEFKNNYSDDNFLKRGGIITSIVLILTILIKIMLITKKELFINNFGDLLITIIQIILLSITIYGYILKKEFTKYFTIASSIALVLMFDIFDIILGILYFLFSINQNYFLNLIELIKKK